jgi:gp16 family phage-associated protein
LDDIVRSQQLPANDEAQRVCLTKVEDFRSRGITVAQWARARDFSPRLVYQVLAGRKALRGKSFQIARALGMK